MTRPKAVIFDCFGTLMVKGLQRYPYRQLQQLMAKHGRRPQRDDNIRMLTMNASLSELATLFGVTTIPAAELARVEADLLAELASLQLYDDVRPVIEQLGAMGIRTAVCSNLAAPYGRMARTLLPRLDAYAWSYEIGAIKPDFAIYEHVCAYLDATPSQLVFVGDSFEADFAGPDAYGMYPIHLVREGPTFVRPSVRSLVEVITQIEPGR